MSKQAANSGKPGESGYIFLFDTTEKIGYFFPMLRSNPVILEFGFPI